MSRPRAINYQPVSTVSGEAHIVMVRMVSHPATRAYVERRTKEGRSKREIIRVLKRYVAREVYHHLPRT